MREQGRRGHPNARGLAVLSNRGVNLPMDESRELHRKIARCRRSLLIISDPGSIRALHGMIEIAERRLTEIEHEEPAVVGQAAS